MSARHVIHTGDVLDVLRTIPDASIDATLSDVPYGLGTHQPTAEELVAYIQGDDLDMGGDFMGRDWQVPSVRVWREIYRVLKPGAPLLIFGGSRTVDLIALGMRAAGFEIRDQLLGWIQAQGMPKPATTTDKYLDAHLGAEREVIGTRVLTGNAAVSTAKKGGTLGIQVGTAPAKEIDVTAPGSEVAKRWEGYGHALRPSVEPVIVARRPLDGSIAENVIAHDVGGLNVKGCRLSTTDPVIAKAASGGFGGLDGYQLGTGRQTDPASPGRWPPNVFFVHAGGPEGCKRVGTRKVKAAPAWNDNRPTPAAFTGEATSTVRHADEDGTETVDVFECVENCPVRMLDEQSGVLHARGNVCSKVREHNNGTPVSTLHGIRTNIEPGWTDSAGGASRFFPCFAWGPEDQWPPVDTALSNLPPSTSVPAESNATAPIDAPDSQRPPREDSPDRSNFSAPSVESDASPSKAPAESAAQTSAPASFGHAIGQPVRSAESASESQATAIAPSAAAISRDQDPGSPHGLASTAAPSPRTRRRNRASSAERPESTATTLTTAVPSSSNGSALPIARNTITSVASEASETDRIPFLYQSKVDKAEREAGCERLPLTTPGGAHNDGPCLKPIAVTTWLARLELPPSRDGSARRLFVPYSGTGSEIIGALRAGWDHVIGIERETHFVEIAEARITRWSEVPTHVDPAEMKASKANANANAAQLDIFSGAR